jgi:hypothetical protein
VQGLRDWRGAVFRGSADIEYGKESVGSPKRSYKRKSHRRITRANQLLNGGVEIFQYRSADGLETSGDVGTQAN